MDNLAIENGLDIKNYPFKWKKAKSLAKMANKTDFASICRFYLELGGETIKK